MAEISFKGFVQRHEGNRPWEIAEGHSKKDEQGNWQTVSKTYHKVWLPAEIGSLNEGDLVEVIGRQITPEKKGDYKPTPIVYASSIVVVKASTKTPASAATGYDSEPF